MADAPHPDKSFLSRWSARKVAVKEGMPVVEPEQDKRVDKLSANDRGLTPHNATAPIQPATVQAESVLTLDDVAALTPASDFSTFVAKGVDSAVKNAAMKKLFADPHYNIMDGLDIYIGDYSTHDVLPQSVIDEITKDGFLNMFQQEEAPPNDDPDLQLQRDDAARREGAVASTFQPPEDPARLETAQPAVPPSGT